MLELHGERAGRRQHVVIACAPPTNCVLARFKKIVRTQQSTWFAAWKSNEWFFGAMQDSQTVVFQWGTSGSEEIFL
eukprot:6483521-Pyramimonas_sp.AAC.1